MPKGTYRDFRQLVQRVEELLRADVPHALAGTGGMDEPGLRAAMTTLLRSPRWRPAVARVLRRMGAKAAPVLIRALNDPSPAARATAARLLTRVRAEGGFGLSTWSSEHPPLAQLRLMARRSPGNVTATYNLAVAYSHLGLLNKAQRWYRKALRLNPSHVQSLHNLAVLEGESGHDPRALALLRQVLTLAPDDELALVNLGYFYLKMGQMDAAYWSLKRAEAVSDNSLPVLLQIGAAFLRHGKPEHALSVLEKTLTLHSEPPVACYLHALARLQLGDYAGAVEELERVRTLLPDMPEVQVALGDARYGLRQWEEASRYYLEALASASEALELSLLDRDPVSRLERGINAEGERDV